MAEPKHPSHASFAVADHPGATPENNTMMQGFEWYVPADERHWERLERQISQLKAWGIDNIWIPPGCKGSSQQGNGYDMYDLYDLGEFDQKGEKGNTSTKWGSRANLETLFKTAHDNGVGIYWDAVLNHRCGADHIETCLAVEVDENDRNRVLTDKYEIEAWVGFDFPGRANGEYSTLRYHWYHFGGVDYNAANGKKAIYRIKGDKGNGEWTQVPDVDGEKGNYDYLMGADVDFSHPEVVSDVEAWGAWLARQFPPSLRGIRFDAVKHFSEDFLCRFIDHLKAQNPGRDWFFVGEFWKDSLDSLRGYLERVGSRFCLFDTPLVYNFSNIGRSEVAGGDLRRVWDGTLVANDPINAVTLVMNHDTQPGQALEVPISAWFKPLAYALILLRPSGYPCIWYGDLYGTQGPNGPTRPLADSALPRLVLARRLFAYGETRDYFDSSSDGRVVGWVRPGTQDRPAGCAVVMSCHGPWEPNGGEGRVRMHVGAEHAGEVWTDLLRQGADAGESNVGGEVTIAADGEGEFVCGAKRVCVFVRGEATGRERFKMDFDSNIYADQSSSE